MASEPNTSGLTYDDLLAMPEDRVRRDLLDGELYVTSPGRRHSRAVLVLGARLLAYEKEHGGETHASVFDVYLSHTNVVEPDAMYVRAEHMERFDDRKLTGPPDLVVEISSPSTRRHDLTKKLEVYERFGVPEYWFIDLHRDVVEVRRLREGYERPQVLGRGEVLRSPELPGFELGVDELLDA